MRQFLLSLAFLSPFSIYGGEPLQTDLLKEFEDLEGTFNRQHMAPSDADLLGRELLETRGNYSLKCIELKDELRSFDATVHFFKERTIDSSEEMLFIHELAPDEDSIKQEFTKGDTQTRKAFHETVRQQMRSERKHPSFEIKNYSRLVESKARLEKGKRQVVAYGNLDNIGAQLVSILRLPHGYLRFRIEHAGLTGDTVSVAHCYARHITPTILMPPPGNQGALVLPLVGSRYSDANIETLFESVSYLTSSKDVKLTAAQTSPERVLVSGSSFGNPVLWEIKLRKPGNSGTLKSLLPEDKTDISFAPAVNGGIQFTGKGSDGVTLASRTAVLTPKGYKLSRDLDSDMLVNISLSDKEMEVAKARPSILVVFTGLTQAMRFYSFVP